MRQFYEAGRGSEKVSPLVRQLPRTHHLIILHATSQQESVTGGGTNSTRRGPTLVAEYQTVLPSRELLRRKLHELYARLAPEPSA